MTSIENISKEKNFNGITIRERIVQTKYGNFSVEKVNIDGVEYEFNDTPRGIMLTTERATSPEVIRNLEKELGGLECKQICPLDTSYTDRAPRVCLVFV